MFSPYARTVAWLLQALALLAALVALPVQAAPNHIAARLLIEGPAAPGQEVTLAIAMQPEAGWHGYWANPGDAGFGMRLEWSNDDVRIEPGPPRYPVPQPLLISGLMNHVFEHDYAVLIPWRVPADARPGAVLPLRVKAQWLACTLEICVPEEAVLDAALTVAAPGAPVPHDARFDGWRRALPAPLGAEARYVVEGKAIRIGIPLPRDLALDAPHLFPEADHIIAYAAPQEFRRKGDLLIVTLARPDIAGTDPATIAGVLRLNAAGDGVAFTAAPGAVPGGGELLAGPGTALSLPLLLAMALAGGLLLNIMPCVFPILSLKALSLARAGESEAEARAEGLAYAAGVVLACTGLGALMLGLRAGGQEVGWAFQLQEPAVVVALLLLAAAITANLAGLFEFAVPGFARAGSPKGAFATGLLAAFVATPCTGPFMAAAMGAALLLPVVQALALFAALGIGIALPFIAIAFVPALRRLLPRPGAWMVWFRKAMALPMALTACALLWLCWRLGGSSFALAAALMAVAALLWLAAIGARQRRGLTARKLVIGLAATLALAAGLTAHLYRPRAAGAVESILPSQPFSEEALAKARAGGRPVFVYFTADWCLTCKVNEAAAIEREDTRTAFAKAGVTVLVGDWTRRDPAITRFLTAQGAAGVPLYLWYAPGSAEPRKLGQVLGSGTLIEQAGMAGD